MSDWVQKWLVGLGLEEYAKLFADQRIDRETLPQLTDADLRELGLPLGPRKKLQRAIEALASDEGGVPAEQDPHGAAAFAETHGHLSAWERLPGERKPVTLLFADITDSTALTETLDAEETHELLYGATQRMCEAVERCRGTVCRFMGDGVMAMFGAPVASEYHAVDACSAALLMQEAVRDYASDTAARYGHRLLIRVGLHSGEVVVLTVGEGESIEYDASGPAVPIASRMEQVATPGAVYLTAATYDLAQGSVEAEALPPVSVKGVSEPLVVFSLSRMRSMQESSAATDRARFVGRRAELSQLRGILTSCLDEGYGQTVHLRGEPGIGKTRLVAEFTAMAEADNVATHRGLVLPYGVGKGQDAVRALVRSLLGLSADAEAAVRSSAINEVIDRGLIDAEQRVHLNELLDLPQPLDLLAVLDAMDRTTRAQAEQRALSALVARSSARRPVLIVVEDLHWADEATLSHVSALARTVVAHPALLVTTSRIEGDPLDQPWRSSTGVSSFTSLELGPLRNEESLELIQWFIDAQDPLARACLKRAAGNPLFLEQLLRNAREGAVESLPDSIQSLVVSRLDRLEPPDKRALQTASVIGQRFDAAVLCHLLQTDSYDLHGLIQHNLIRAEGSRFLFTHALIQEGVYGSLLKRHRQILHTRCAEYFADSDAALAAEHLDHAEDEGAARAYDRAAREQAEQYRFDRAIQLATRGLALGPTDEVRHSLRCLTGMLMRELDDVEGSKVAFQQALDEAPDDRHRCEAWLGLAACLRITDDYEGALALLERAEPVASRYQLRRELSQLHHLRGNLYFTTGNTDGCYAEHTIALEHARASGAVEEEVRALGGIADAECARGRMRSAYDAFRLCVDRCRTIGLGRVEVANGSQMTNCGVYLASAPNVVAASREVVAKTTRVGNLRAEVNGLVGICNIAVDMGDAALLMATADRGIAIARQIKSRAWEGMVTSFVAMADYFEGRLDDAIAVAERAVDLGSDARSFVGGWTLGPLIVVTDDPERRQEALREGDELAEAGMNGEGYLQFLRYAMLGCWRANLWDELERYAGVLERYTSSEPTLWSDFMVRRGRLLARAGRGEHEAGLADELRALRARAVELGYAASVMDIDSVLAGMNPR